MAPPRRQTLHRQLRLSLQLKRYGPQSERVVSAAGRPQQASYGLREIRAETLAKAGPTVALIRGLIVSSTVLREQRMRAQRPHARGVDYRESLAQLPRPTRRTQQRLREPARH